MKKNVLALLALGTLMFTGCNAIGDKDTIIGRVNGESIYQEDIDLMVRLQGESSKSEKMRNSVASLLVATLFILPQSNAILNSRMKSKTAARLLKITF